MKGAHFYIICGLIGLVFQTLVKYNSYSTDARKANTHLNFVLFLKNDWVMLCLGFLPVIAWYFTYAEVMENYPKLHGWTRVTFIGVGLFGADSALRLYSKTKENIRKVIDRKTDIADKVTGT